ncbi:MAG: hypothetical protein HDT44_06215 [Ruminococcaceae bacterium]|nr:hypothetical protein [Oscillospiraceae bacterium]
MAEAEKKKNKTLLIVIIVLAVLIIAGLTTVIVLLLNKDDKPIQDNNNNGGLIDYQPGVIGVNVDDFQAEFDQAVKDMQNSSIGIIFNNYAVSEDGKNFKCYLGNAEGNGKDIYFNIYKDISFSEQILLTGLIPPGSGIDTFESEIDLDPGQYEAVLVLTKVDDDHSTILTQTNVQITLQVNG